MALKKSYAAKVTYKTFEVKNSDGSISYVNKPILGEQRDVDMHPLEEASIRAHWAIHDVQIKIPPKPSQEEEHEMLINQGADAVKKSRADWQAVSDAIQPELDAAYKAHQAADAEWVKHAERAHANGFDPDTHPNARNLPMPEENK